MANTYATAAGLADVTKEAWSSQEVAKQFYDENPLLAKFRAVTGTTMGTQVQTPIYSHLPGGYASTDAAGGTIQQTNPAGVAQAAWTLVYHWFQTGVETGALNQTATNAQAVISAKNIEMEGAISAVSRQCSRQLACDGTGFIGAVTAAGPATTFTLTASGQGPNAAERGWLWPGLTVDIGTTSDSDASGSAVVLTGVDDVAGTFTTSSITVASSSFISISNPNSATATNPELNGLGNIVSAGTLGGINPATAGNEYWQSYVDSATTVLSLDLILNLRRKVKMKNGQRGGETLALGLKQEQALYLLLQNQVRYGSDGSISAGASSQVKWSDMNILAMNDILDKNLFVLTMSDFIRATGDIKEPTWVSDLEGAGGDLRWRQGATNFVNALVFPFQVGVQRRNSHAGASALT